MSITHTGTEESTGSYGERDRRTTHLLAQARAESDPAHAARLRERAVMANEGLAVGLATRFAGRGIDLDDLVPDADQDDETADAGTEQVSEVEQPSDGEGDAQPGAGAEQE